MTREEAINYLRSSGMTEEQIDEVTDALEQRWIPVSERLPEKNGEYLITGRQGAVNKRRYHDGYWYGNWNVIAWMPLPEPYRAESEDKA